MNMHHLVILRILKNKELSEIYAMMSFRAMAMFMISIFVPVYLYTLGYGVQVILAFFAIASASQAIFSFVAAKISSIVGLKHVMLLSFLVSFPYYVMLTMLPTNEGLTYFAAVVFGISQALFWVPFHALFASMTDKKKRGEEVALLDIFPSVFSILAPFIGGIIILFFGFDILFFVGIGILMAAALPLFVSRDFCMPFKPSFRVKGFNRRVAASLMAYDYAIDEIIWPVFVFIMVGSTAVLGGIITFGILIGFAVVWVAGELCDKGYRKNLLRLGSVGQSVLWVVRSLVSSLSHVIVLEPVWRIFYKLTLTSYHSAYYEKAKRTKKKLEFTVLREISIHSSIVATFGLMAVLYSYIPHIGVIFLVAIPGTLLHMLIEK